MKISDATIEVTAKDYNITEEQVREIANRSNDWKAFFIALEMINLMAIINRGNGE